jgi:hypothetical protein
MGALDMDVGAAGEIAKVSHTLTPEGRARASNSPRAFMFK